jgi:hypothetical protein
MNILVTYIGDVSAHVDYVYQAIDADTYDGAPDSRDHPVGFGRTKVEAARELLDQIEEAGDE